MANQHQSTKQPTKKREGLGFNERLWDELKRHERKLELSSADRELREDYRERLSYSGTVLVMVGIILAACFMFFVLLTVFDRGSENTKVGFWLGTVVSAVIFTALIEHRKALARQLDHLTHPVAPGSFADPLEPSITNMLTYVNCIGYACTEDEQPVFDAARRLNDLLVKATELSARLDQLYLTNNIESYDDCCDVLENLEQAVALEVHHAVNVLVGCGQTKFIEAVTSAAEHCESAFSSAEEYFRTLVDSLNGADVPLEVPEALQRFTKKEAASDEEDSAAASVADTSSEAQPFSERLRDIIARHFDQFDFIGGREVADLTEDLKHETRRSNLWFGITSACSLVIIAMMVFSVLGCLYLFIWHPAASSPMISRLEVSGVIITIAVLLFWFASYQHAKYAAAVEEAEDALCRLKKSLTIEPTSHSARLLVACALSACTDSDADSVRQGALTLKQAFDDFDELKTRYLSLSQLNHIVAEQEIVGLLDAAERAIAINVHHAINVIVGVGTAAFVVEGAPTASKKCAGVNRSLGRALKSLVECANRDKGDLRQVIAEIEALTTAYQQFAEQNFPAPVAVETTEEPSSSDVS